MPNKSYSVAAKHHINRIFASNRHRSILEFSVGGSLRALESMATMPIRTQYPVVNLAIMRWHRKAREKARSRRQAAAMPRPLSQPSPRRHGHPAAAVVGVAITATAVLVGVAARHSVKLLPTLGRSFRGMIRHASAPLRSISSHLSAHSRLAAARNTSNRQPRADAGARVLQQLPAERQAEHVLLQAPATAAAMHSAFDRPQVHAATTTVTSREIDGYDLGAPRVHESGDRVQEGEAETAGQGGGGREVAEEGQHEGTAQRVQAPAIEAIWREVQMQVYVQGQQQHEEQGEGEEHQQQTGEQGQAAPHASSGQVARGGQRQEPVVVSAEEQPPTSAAAEAQALPPFGEVAVIGEEEQQERQAVAGPLQRLQRQQEGALQVPQAAPAQADPIPIPAPSTPVMQDLLTPAPASSTHHITAKGLLQPLATQQQQAPAAATAANSGSAVAADAAPAAISTTSIVAPAIAVATANAGPTAIKRTLSTSVPKHPQQLQPLQQLQEPAPAAADATAVVSGSGRTAAATGPTQRATSTLAGSGVQLSPQQEEAWAPLAGRTIPAAAASPITVQGSTSSAVLPPPQQDQQQQQQHDDPGATAATISASIASGNGPSGPATLQRTGSFTQQLLQRLRRVSFSKGAGDSSQPPTPAHSVAPPPAAHPLGQGTVGGEAQAQAHVQLQRRWSGNGLKRQLSGPKLPSGGCFPFGKPPAAY